MEKLKLSVVADSCGGRLSVPGAASVEVCGVSSDTRDIREGDLFVALKGERFNGHDFLGDAAGRGAVAAMVERGEMERRASPVPLVMVQDSLAGLQALARSYREGLGTRAVAIAGSNGKTGTKDMVAAVLAARFAVLKTAGNLNNHIGVPMSLLKLERAHEAGVFEVGTNHPGELLPLLEMVQPVAGVITTIGEEHLEFFHDLDGVAQEEGTLAEVMPADGLLVLNADDAWSAPIAARAKSRVVTFGFSRDADYRATAVGVGLEGTRFNLNTPDGQCEVRLRLIGRHQVSNALAAAAVGGFFGLALEEIAKGLESVAPSKMRMQPSTTRGGVVILNDAYNANPHSMRAALRTLREIAVAGRRFAVLGEMRELGAVSESSHREVGRQAADSDLDCLVVVGEGARAIAAGARTAKTPPPQVESFEGPAEAREFLRRRVRAGDVVLLKASRGAALERVMEDWE